jgi:hypothetical protein
MLPWEMAKEKRHRDAVNVRAPGKSTFFQLNLTEALYEGRKNQEAIENGINKIAKI